MNPRPGEIWQWSGQYKDSAPQIATILMLKEVHDTVSIGLVFIGHCFDTGESREWYFTKGNINRWKRVA